MSDEPAATAATAFLEKITHSAFSTDGEQAMIAFVNKAGEPFILTMAAERIYSLQALCTQMRKRQARRDMPLNLVGQNFPKQISVGHSDTMRGVVALTFDELSVDEAIYILPNEVGLQIAKQLEQNILSRMSQKERHDWARKNNPLLLPIDRKIITPGT